MTMYDKIRAAYRAGWVDDAYLERAVRASIITAEQAGVIKAGT